MQKDGAWVAVYKKTLQRNFFQEFLNLDYIF